MTDDRDLSWLGPPAPAAVPPVERRLWIVVKDARSATAHVRPHPLGDELVCRVGAEFLWSRVFRAGDAAGLQGESQAARDAFLARGWQPAE